MDFQKLGMCFLLELGHQIRKSSLSRVVTIDESISLGRLSRRASRERVSIDSIEETVGEARQQSGASTRATRYLDDIQRPTDSE